MFNDQLAVIIHSGVGRICDIILCKEKNVLQRNEWGGRVQNDQNLT